MSTPGPVTAAERHLSLDVIRGSAVLGILLMNIWAFAGPQAYFDFPPAAAGLPGAPVATWAVVHTLFEGSQRALFSLLFGAGMLLMVQRLEAAGPPVRPGRTYYRRLGILILIGLFDAFVLLWPADILVTYGLCGLLLYPVRRLSTGRLLALALLVMAVSAGLRVADLNEARDLRAALALDEAAVAAGEAAPAGADERAAAWARIESRARPDMSSAEEQESLRIVGRGSFGEFWRERAKTSLILQTVVALNAWVLDALAVMLLGMAALKTGLLTRTASGRTLALLVGLGYGIGLPLSLAETVVLLRTGFDPVADKAFLIIYDLRRLGMAAGHLGLLLWLVRSPVAVGLKTRLAAVGRMALSGYLAQSVLCGLIFYTVGLGLYGRFTGYWLYGVVALVWALLLTAAPWWLARYRHGPAERLWRTLTYGRGL